MRQGNKSQKVLYMPEKRYLIWHSAIFEKL